jgi:hypothetical protein
MCLTDREMSSGALQNGEPTVSHCPPGRLLEARLNGKYVVRGIDNCRPDSGTLQCRAAVVGPIRSCLRTGPCRPLRGDANVPRRDRVHANRWPLGFDIRHDSDARYQRYQFKYQHALANCLAAGRSRKTLTYRCLLTFWILWAIERLLGAPESSLRLTDHSPNWDHW